jgi:hypothetical protein
VHSGLNNPTHLLLHLREGPCTDPYSDKSLKDSQAFNPAAFPGLWEGCRKTSRAVWALNPVAFPGLWEGCRKSLNGVQAFIPHRQRPSRVEGGLPKTFQRFEGGPSKKLKPSGRSLLPQTFQV